MSKFVELLNRVGLQSPNPIGFGADATGGLQSTPELVLIARVLPDEVAKSPGLGDAHVDAFLIAADSTKDRTAAFAKALKERVWGVRSREISAAQAQKLAGKGCDFVCFESLDTEAALLIEEDLGVVATVRVTGSEDGVSYTVPEMTDEAVHALSGLPLDGVLYSPALRGLPLSVKTTADIQRVLGVMDKPLIVELPEGAGQGDIELLRNMGVAGLIVDLDGPGGMGRIAEVKRDIDDLPRRRERRFNKDALLPQSPASAQGGVPDTSDDDFDDDDF